MHLSCLLLFGLVLLTGISVSINRDKTYFVLKLSVINWTLTDIYLWTVSRNTATATPASNRYILSTETDCFRRTVSSPLTVSVPSVDSAYSAESTDGTLTKSATKSVFFQYSKYCRELAFATRQLGLVMRTPGCVFRLLCRFVTRIVSLRYIIQIK